MAIGNNKGFAVIRVGTTDRREEADMYLYFLNAAKIDNTDILVVAVSATFRAEYRAAIETGRVPNLPMEFTAQAICEQLEKVTNIKQKLQAGKKVDASDFYLLGMAGMISLVGAGAPIDDGGIKHFGFGLIKGGAGYHLTRMTGAGEESKAIPGPMVRAAFRRGPLASGTLRA